MIKASFFSKKTDLICLSDESGLEIDILNGEPGIYSSRWAGEKNDFDLGIKKIFEKINKVEKIWSKNKKSRFVCCMTLFWPNGKNLSSKGVVEGKISNKKKGNKVFGYDPIFIPDGYEQTFGEMESNLKMSIDHRYKACSKIEKFFFKKPL